MRKIILSLILISLLALPIVGLAQAPRRAPTVDVMQMLDKIVDWLFKSETLIPFDV